ncbi:hypothetical protein NHX12_022535, partial [Muraenolepis orangiensis]
PPPLPPLLPASPPPSSPWRRPLTSVGWATCQLCHLSSVSVLTLSDTKSSSIWGWTESWLSKALQLATVLPVKTPSPRRAPYWAP